ncbi:MAG TPA: serine/threonine-protein kinase [Vicinamibacterales bacterium]|nr:serine/threonine-protein kinase [Vicinamibacterales bacterium]
MNESRWSYLDALFDEALALPPESRRSFLDLRCAGDPASRRELEELLRLATEPSSLLQPGTVAPAFLRDALARVEPAASGPLAAAEKVGVWRVLHEIGRGGMGTVYLAERDDGEFQQQGALKLVHASVAPEEIAQRLRRERRILASLTHANIARLLDGGQTRDGRPFLVMEYVDGRRIDRYCDEERLGIEQRLDLFGRVCAGVQHAHRNLVVHRDIKPSNIIVTRDGEVKLLDFGIARLLAAADRLDDPMTQPVMRILTPEYASPEQVRGEAVAIASDVYQLGLLLYELLTGRKAQTISGTSQAEMEQAVCAAQPPRPSSRVAGDQQAAQARGVTATTLVRRLSGDLDTIVLYALRKEPDRRYASVDELVGDVERFRLGLPIRAHVDSFRYRVRKFVGRRRAALAWSATAIAIAAIALPAVIGERLRSARESARAEQIETILADMFAFASPRVLVPRPTARHYVDHAAALVQRELHGQPASQARLLFKIGDVYNALGEYGAAIEAVTGSLKLRRDLYGPDSLQAAHALATLGLSQHYAGLYDEAEASFQEALAGLRARSGPTAPDTVGTMVEFGDLLHTRGRLIEAEQMLRGAVGPLRTFVPGDGDDALPRAIMYLANVLRDRGSFAEGEALYREAIDGFVGVHGRHNQQVAVAQSYLARLLVMRSDVTAAEPLLDEALRVLRNTYDGNHPLVGTALRELGYLRIEQGRFADAASVLDESIRIHQRLLGSHHSLVPRTRAHQAELARRRGATREAVAVARETVGEFARIGLSDHPSALDVRATLGEALVAMGDRPAGVRELRQALLAAQRQFVAGDRRIARLRDALTRAQPAER